MNTSVLVAHLMRLESDVPVLDDVGPDEEVGCANLLLLEEGVELAPWWEGPIVL